MSCWPEKRSFWLSNFSPREPDVAPNKQAESLDRPLPHFGVSIACRDPLRDHLVDLCKVVAILGLARRAPRRSESLDEALNGRKCLTRHFGVAVLSRCDKRWYDLG